MIILDTDHLSVFRFAETPRAALLRGRLSGANDARVVTTIISYEEQLRGWFAEIKRARDPMDEVTAYAQLLRMIDLFQRWELLAYDESAAREFMRLRRLRVRVGAQDLKIASIAVTQGALLLSANLADFRRVPGLQVEDWLHAPAPEPRDKAEE
jgi:tRNA(fMet)-specific endonuclease VapC